MEQSLNHQLSNQPWDAGDLFGPLSDPRRRPAQRPPQSYATVTKKQSTTTLTQPLPLHATEVDRQHRTHILRRLGPDVTPNDIIRQLTQQLGIPEHELLEAVLRDPKDRRRFYVTYTTSAQKQHALGKGFHIGDIHIKPQDDKIDGYIPFPPYYIDLDSLNALIQDHGELVSSSFVQTANKTRVAGYKFSIKLKKGVVRPTSIVYNTCEMQIRYTDDLKMCTHCRKSGHLVATCKARIAAQQELQQRRELYFEELHNDYNISMIAIQHTAEANLHIGYQDHQRDLQNIADVYQHDLAELHQSRAKPENLQHWEAAYNARVKTITEYYHEDQQDHLNDAAQSKAEEDEKYTAAGGPPDHTTKNPMEIDIDDIPLHAVTESTAAVPTGDVVDDIRAELHRLMFQYQKDALREAAQSLLPPAPVNPDSPSEEQLLNAVANVTAETILPILLQVQDTSVIPVSKTPAAKSDIPTVKTKKKSRSRSRSRQSRKKTLSTTEPAAEAPVEHHRTMREWSQILPKQFDTTHCHHTITFTCSTPNTSKILLHALNETLSTVPLNHGNPAASVIQTAHGDGTHFCIFIRDADVRDLTYSILMTCHANNTLALTSKLEVGANPNYNTATADKTK